MNGRFLVIGTILGALAMFAWQTVSNAALPWHEKTMHEFANSDSLARTIRAAAPTNGVYWSKQGVLAAVSMTPDLADKTSSAFMAPMLGKQLAIDLVVAFVLCLLLLRLPAASLVHTGRTFAMAGLAIALLIELSNWNWYGFAANFALVNAVDTTIQFFVTGVVLAWAARRFGAPRAAEASGVNVPAGAGYAAKPNEATSRVS